ncbi:MAG: universal stress protein [Chloroflexi bacterium]|nr:universal stress protein [Chloroflexota bacterium]
MYENILVPLDGSALAECVLPHVEELGRGCRVNRLTLARVVDLPGIPIVAETGSIPMQEKLELAREQFEADLKREAQEYLDSVAARLKVNTAVTPVVLAGRPETCLLEYAQSSGVDLIIIASHGRSGISRWVWGSVADRLLRASPAPVFMVRSPGCALA